MHANIKQIFVINPTMTNVSRDYKELNNSFQALSGNTIVPGRFDITLEAPLTYKEGWPDPDARKVIVKV